MICSRELTANVRERSPARRLSVTESERRPSGRPGHSVHNEYALPADGEFAATERHRTAGSGAVCPALPFSCAGVALPMAPPARCRLSPSLADFGDAEVAKAGAAMEGRRSAAGPDAIAPAGAPDINASEITADAEQAERPQAAAPGIRRTCAAGLEFGSGWCSPSRRAIRPNSAPLRRRLPRRCRNRRAPPSPSARSSSARPAAGRRRAGGVFRGQ
jgi:hypothetical protein